MPKSKEMTNTARIFKKRVLKSRDPVKSVLKQETSKSSVKTVSIFRGYKHCMTKATSNIFYVICFFFCLPVRSLFLSLRI